MADFSIGSVGEQLGDVQRTYTWELRLKLPSIIPNIEDITEDILRIHCRSVVIPGRSQDVITSNYMGMEQFFPGRMHFTNPFNITFEEFSERKVAKALYSWQQLLMSIRTGSGTFKANAVSHQCQLQLLDYQGAEIAQSKFGLIQINNAWPESVAEVPLSYAESNSIQYTLALRYDTWEYLPKSL